MISCILLSAGLSSRFGSPKALASLGRITVIEYLLQMLLKTHVEDIIVVLGAQKELIEPYIFKHENIRIVYNKDYILGQTSSFKTGLSHLTSSKDAFFLLPIDYPFVKSITMDGLLAYQKEKEPLITIPTYSASNGHPPLFSMKLYQELLAMPEDQGLNQLIRRYIQDVSFIPVSDQGVIKTFNTPEEFRDISSAVILE